MFEYIEKSLKKRGIELDSAQSDLIRKMIESIQPEKDLTNKLENKNSKKGFYIWGDVGTGKTLITKSFINLLTERKASFHYMELMQIIHDELSGLSGKKNPLNIGTINQAFYSIKCCRWKSKICFMGMNNFNYLQHHILFYFMIANPISCFSKCINEKI